MTTDCPNDAGSLNNPANNDQAAPYAQVNPAIGQWQISTQTDLCAQNETFNQTSYAAENININGAPLNIYKLLGVHEQGNGSVLAQGVMFSSQPAPGYPLSNLASNQPWQSLQVGSAVGGVAYIGVDFGNSQVPFPTPTGQSEYAPPKPNWQPVGSVAIAQGNTAFNFARQVRIDITDGTTVIGQPVFSGTGNGVMAFITPGPETTLSSITVMATSDTTFSVTSKPVNGPMISLGQATIGVPFQSTAINFTITAGTTPFAVGDIFSVQIDYAWKRAGVYNLVQSADPTRMNLQTTQYVKAVRVVPTLFTGTGNWEIDSFDVFDSPSTDINNIQDLFFQENRDRDYSTQSVMIKAQYQIADASTDLSKFGLNLLEQYSFTVSFPVMVQKLGRPIVVGDIVEVTPELQYDQNLKPVRKFVEVTDTGWSSQGFSTAWFPTLFRFTAQPAIPSQETRDIFGSIDTEKYLTSDSIIGSAIGSQVDTTPLTTVEEIASEAARMVPERGSNDGREVFGVPVPEPLAPVNPNGQPQAVQSTFVQNTYIEDGLPPDDRPYTEGYSLPDVNTSHDGEYFRLYYPASTGIMPRLYRFSALKNRWIFLEQDKRIQYASAKPSIHRILQSPTKQDLRKK